MRRFLLLLLMCLACFKLGAGRGSRSGGGSRSSSGGGARYSSGGGYRSSSTRYSSGGGFGSSRSFGSSGTRFGSSDTRFGSSGTRFGSSGGSRIGGSRISGDNWGITRGSRISAHRIRSRTSDGSRFGQRGSRGNSFGRNRGRSRFRSRRGYGFKSNKGKGPSFFTPGYGTKWGTSFGKGIGKKGISKKTLGLGVAAGFVGGAAIGGVATYGVYHRYNKYRDLMYRNRHGYGFGRGHEYDDDFGYGYADYYNNYYMRDRCFGGCPHFAQCRYGFCECPYGYTRRWGRCSQNWNTERDTGPRHVHPLSKNCGENQACWKYDLNLICNTVEWKCKCRRDMKWNSEDMECQLYLDVDCRKFTYDTPPDPVILEAVKKTERRIEAATENKANLNLLIPGKETDPAILNETAAIDLNTTLSNSLLSAIDPITASKSQITEAYCRDVDSLSFEFQKGSIQTRFHTSGAINNSISVLLCFLKVVLTYSLLH